MGIIGTPPRAEAGAAHGQELQMSWDVAPAPVHVYGTFGHHAASAGGVPTVGAVSTTQYLPTSRTDFLAREHPALASQIRGAAQQQELIDQLSLMAVAGLAGGVADLALAAEGAAGAGGRQVLLDSNVVTQLGRDPTLGGRLAAGEQPVVSYVTGPELRNAVATGGGLRGVPRALGDVPVLEARPSLDGIINFRGGLVRTTGRFGDGIIGAQATEFGIPLITNDAELGAAVVRSGGTVR
jgi:predicted nucleic acid-binding protein